MDVINHLPYDSLLIVDGSKFGYMIGRDNEYLRMLINDEYENVERSRVTIPPTLLKTLEPELKRVARDIRIDKLLDSKYNRQTEYEIAKAKYKRSMNEDN